MVLVAKFDVGDIVKVGPIVDGMITEISFSSTLTYTVSYWIDQTAATYRAWEWELTLVAKAPIADEDKPYQGG